MFPLLQFFIKKLFELLQSEKVSLYIKLLMLRSLFETGSRSRVYSELRDVREMVVENSNEEIRKIINSVFSEFNDRYVNTELSIYDNEDNPFYVMYQWWSGDESRLTEIIAIRKVAKRALEANPEAIHEFWKSYPDQDGIKKGLALGDIGESVYISLEDLIAVTKKSPLFEEYRDRIDYWQANKAEHADILRLRIPTENRSVTLKRILEDLSFLEKPIVEDVKMLKQPD